MGDTWRYSFSERFWERVELGIEPRRHSAAVMSNKGIVLTGGTVSSMNGATDVLQIFPF
jgi:hypothetical protein